MNKIRELHKRWIYLDKTCIDCVNLIYPTNNIQTKINNEILICGLGSIGSRHTKNLISLGFNDIILLRLEK